LPDGDVLKRTLRSQENSQPDSNEGPGAVLDAMPVLSVVSISAVIAGWFWRERRRLRRMGLGGKVSRRSRQRRLRGAESAG
jgi:hypothetical protein